MELQVQIAGGKWSGLALSIKTFLPKTGVSKNFLYFHRESGIYFDQKTEISERLYIFTKKTRNLQKKLHSFKTEILAHFIKNLKILLYFSNTESLAPSVKKFYTFLKTDLLAYFTKI